MVAALTPLPVIGVPVRASALDGLDSLLSIVQVYPFLTSMLFTCGMKSFAKIQYPTNTILV
jgi:hypothetical protein